MANRTELTVIEPDQSKGKVLPQFEITGELLGQASQFVMNYKTLYESQRYSIQGAATNRKSWRDRLIQMDRAYRAILEPDRTYKGYSDKAAPIIHNNIEMLVARIKESIIFTRPDRMIKLDTKLPTKEYREDQLNTQLEKQNVEEKIERFVRSVAKFGTAWIKVPLVNTERTVLTQQLVTITEEIPIVDDANQQIIDPQTGQPAVHVTQRQELQVVPQVDKKYFGPGYEVIEDIERIYADVFIENPQDQPIIIEEVIVSWEHLMKGVEKGIYIEEQVAKIKGKQMSSSLGFGSWNATRSETIWGNVGINFNNSMTSSQNKPKEYRMYQAWCDFAIPYTDENGDSQQRVYPCVISVIENTVIQIAPNPFFHQMKPYIKGVWHRIEGECYGQSAIDPVLGLYHSYNDTLNQIEDNKVLKLNGVTITKAGNIADKQDFNIGAGEVWYEKETGDIRPYIVDFPMAEGVQYLNQLEEQINRGMGISSLMQGSGDSTDADKTWRGVNKVISETEKPFKLVAKGLEDACVRQWAELALKTNIQFDPLPVGVETFETINSEAGVKVFGVDSYFQTAEDIEKMMTVIPQLAQIPGFNIPGLAQAAVDLMKLNYDAEKYGPMYTPPQPPPPPPPEDKPMNTSVSIPVDMSKGPTMLFTAAQILQQKGIQLNIDSIAEATKIFAQEFDMDSKAQSGLMPPSYDSYTKGDSRKKDMKEEPEEEEEEEEKPKRGKKKGILGEDND